jgi:hypothetical protein
MGKVRLLILYPQTGLYAIPSLVAMIRALTAKDFSIDIYTSQNESYTAPEFVEADIRVIILPGKLQQGHSGWR